MYTYVRVYVQYMHLHIYACIVQISSLSFEVWTDRQVLCSRGAGWRDVIGK